MVTGIPFAVILSKGCRCSFPLHHAYTNRTRVNNQGVAGEYGAGNGTQTVQTVRIRALPSNMLTVPCEQEAAGIKADSVIARRVDEVASKLRRRYVQEMTMPAGTVWTADIPRCCFCLFRIELFNDSHDSAITSALQIRWPLTIRTVYAGTLLRFGVVGATDNSSVLMLSRKRLSACFARSWRQAG